jgi:uncharacterized MAPEG superfamily protein
MAGLDILDRLGVGPNYATRLDPNTAARAAAAQQSTFLNYAVIAGALLLAVMLGAAFFRKRK